LEHIIRYLAAQDITRFILCVGYRAEAIREFVRTFKETGWDIECVDSGDATMTDRLLDARERLSGPMLMCYGDTLANVDVRQLRAEHEKNSALATMTVYPFYSPFGIVNVDSDDHITKFSEKPRLPYWINIGYMFSELCALDLVSRNSDMPEFLIALAASGSLHAFRHEGRHLTINTEKERASAETQIVDFFTVLDHGERRSTANTKSEPTSAETELIDLFAFNQEAF